MRFTRDIATVTMDLNAVEQIDYTAFGGADTVVVNSLVGTSVKNVHVNLSADGVADSVIVNGTSHNDLIRVAGSLGAATVTGLAAQVRITGADATLDRLTVNGLGGDDSISAANLPAGILLYTANGDDGNDVLVGSAGDDILNGEAGNDVISGGPGADTLDGGTGNNILKQD